jgi:hypothetical protein
VIIRTSPTILTALYDGPLTYDSNSTGLRNAISDIPAINLPRVVVGEPQWWNLEILLAAGDNELPGELQLLLKEAHFYVVRFACSFREQDDSVFERARFIVELESIGSNDSAIVYDLHPQEVYAEKRRDMSLKIAPSLRFGEVEASVGEATLLFQYDRIEPAITAAGALTPICSWDISPTREHPVRGIRWFHAIVKCPIDSVGIVTRLSITASIRSKGSVFRASARSADTSSLVSRKIFDE